MWKGNVTVNNRLLVILMTNDNHLSNVKTLQSIYTQDYPDIYLVICNDCTDQFQNERLLYNFSNGKPENIKQIVFHENPIPMGEYVSQRQFWNYFHADYIVTIHSGEYFVSPQALTRCIKYLQYDSSVAAVVASAELWSDDMKKCLSLYTAVEEKTDIERDVKKTQIEIGKLRDCMLIWRTESINISNDECVHENSCVGQDICVALLRKQKEVMVLPISLCKFSKQSIRSTVASIPNTYGSVVLQSIAALLHFPKAKRGGDIGRRTPAVENHTSEKQRNRNLKLYQYSRLTKLKIYAVIEFILILSTVALLFTNNTVRIVLGVLLIIAVVALFIWMIAMLLCNLYFKKNPQRLVL